jgi:putative hydrolase of HD superfamily
MMLADEIRARGVAIDVERVLRMALVHDWAETRVGDMPKTVSVYFGEDVRKQAELRAFGDIVNGAGAGKSGYERLYKDYEERNSIEARLVKAADVIDLLIEAHALERAGAAGLDEFWEVALTAEFGLPEAADFIVKDLIQSLLKAHSETVRR